MITWIKPSGVTLQTNEHPANIAAAEAAGWVREGHGEDVDVRGIEWDARLHTSNKSTNEDGSWRYKKGVTAEAEAALLGLSD